MSNDICLTNQNATVQTRAVEYEYEGTKLKGFLACKDASKGLRPGILVFTEWWGLNANAQNRARQLAELGYVALVADVYGGGKVIDISQPEEAAKMAATLRTDTKTWRGRATAALDQLSSESTVDTSKVAAIGYCLDSALQLAYTGAELKAVVTFHSTLPMPTTNEAKAIQAKILVCVGGADPFIPGKSIEDWRAALDAAGVKPDVAIYEGVVHSFTSPDADKVGNPALKYDRSAAEDSWKRMSKLFSRTFKTQ